MTKRYREALDQVMVGAGGAAEPQAFRWRGQHYQVLQVLGHWREDTGWWRRPDGQPIRIEQTDLWRVEARHWVGPGRVKRNGVPTSQGIYELVHRAGEWKLDRVWD